MANKAIRCIYFKQGEPAGGKLIDKEVFEDFKKNTEWPISQEK